MRSSRSHVLFQLGFVTLFLELALIRYLPGSIWNLGYFPNLVLMSVFMGMGVGFLFHHRLSSRASDATFAGASIGLLALLGFVAVAHPHIPGFKDSAGVIGGELFFTAAPQSTSDSWALFVVWFLALVVIFAAISQRTARVFKELDPLHAYTLDIAGSCAGIVAFMVISALQLPAWSWFLIALAPYLLASPTGRGALAVAVVAFLSMAGIARQQDGILTADRTYRGEHRVHWSPYQKIETAEDGEDWMIFANGITHQQTATLETLDRSIYRIPYVTRASREGLAPYRRVLVMGAGCGNDVATALAAGVEHVDAVEIDPAIAELGSSLHPAKPYRDPRVTVTVDDARAFMTRSKGGFDLAIFASTDSLVRTSSVSQIRLENYLFTTESIRRAWELLGPDGDIVFQNSYRRPWIAAKLARMIRDATGRVPRIIYADESVLMMAVSRRDGFEPAAGSPEAIAAHATTVEPAIDDWPFLYVRARGIPPLYQFTMAILGALVGILLLLARRGAGIGAGQTAGQTAGEAGPAALCERLAFVCMGAAFLLLETKSIVQFSLLFGTTWRNASFVFLAVLLLVLAANHVARLLKPGAMTAAYLLLVASCVVSLLFPLARLLAVESVPLRLLAASLLTFAPIFFANLIFSLNFRDRPHAENLFGWNLMGAMVGGLLEYTSMGIGYANLAILVAVIYTAAVALLYASRWYGARDAAPTAPSE